MYSDQLLVKVNELEALDFPEVNYTDEGHKQFENQIIKIISNICIEVSF